MRAISLHRYTWDEYVELERASNVKHEFLNGEIYAMAGGSPEHSAVAANVIATLHEQLRGRPCRVYTSDLRIRVQRTGLATYPDASVCCGELHRDAKDKNTILNPTVVVEVLSPSTENYDRETKLEHFQQIPSLQEIVLIAHREQLIEVFRRGADDAWVRLEARGAESVALEYPFTGSVALMGGIRSGSERNGDELATGWVL